MAVECLRLDMWTQLRHVYPIISGEISNATNEHTINDILQNLSKLDISVEDLVLERINCYLQQKIIPNFWSYFQATESDLEGFEKFRDAVENLYNSLELFMPQLSRLEILRSLKGKGDAEVEEYSIISVFRDMVKAALHSDLSLYTKRVMESFYRTSFKVFCNADKSPQDGDESAEDFLHCGGCNHEIEQCQCQAILQVFHQVNRKLVELELLECLAGEVLTSLIHVRIANHVQESCKGSFDLSHINSLQNWLKTVVMGWLSQIYCEVPDQNVSANINRQKTIEKFNHKLTHYLYETYTRTRIDQLFNIIIEYPDSQPAIEDLRICLQKTDLRPYLTQKLQQALETRLLHPGVNTPDVLQAYVAAIRALRQLDPTGVLLETVTEPVRLYLRGREDTVRCVVSSLTEEGPCDLTEELARAGGDEGRLRLLSFENEVGPSDDETDANWETWEPDPVEADPTSTSKNQRRSDIILMLVNVYGSKDVFVNEYRTLLADRLLSQLSYHTEKEIRYLELLKLRFGESHLHYCEVMLKDVYDSKRINAHVHSDENFRSDNQQFPCRAMILSAQFWPAFKEENLVLPPVVTEHLDAYTKAFETLKGNRTLCWKPHLGAVAIDIELKDRTLHLAVTPIHATIIWHFQSKSQWTIEELNQVMRVPSTMLRRKIAFWQSQGVLKEVSTDTFVVVEECPNRSKASTSAVISSEMMCEDEEAESAMASAHDQREEELQVFWSYIVGMLTNLGSLPLERIHQMLKMFASQGPTSVECSLQELRHFLDRKVREHKLLFSNGLYRLPKP
ncbi:anaphase-promoting complex subunit 2 [Ischnura elegans]|uniref:anaphase-promoting complex subunit 2 n=1 Tax=Ischnura elegans TaxID=197161 RepID=UPI001ED8941B|nr:anaphase-promoting complex subunit 2 [Ischnura elegans]